MKERNEMTLRDILDMTYDELENAIIQYYKEYPQDERHNTTFEDYLSINYFKCSNCCKWTHNDDKGTTELALQDNICKYCIEDGYNE